MKPENLQASHSKDYGWEEPTTAHPYTENHTASRLCLDQVVRSPTYLEVEVHGEVAVEAGAGAQYVSVAVQCRWWLAMSAVAHA